MRSMARVLAATLLVFALVAACGGSTNDDSKDGSPTAGAANAGSSSGGSAAGTAMAGTSSGGSVSAGTHSGGAASAGTDNGGTDGGASAAGAAGSSSGESPAAECDQNEDCKVVDDCCTCDVVPIATKGLACASACKQSACQASGYAEPKAACVGHRCIFDISCKSEEVTCKSAKPTCSAGLVPGVIGSCWGPCVRPDQCSRLDDCKSCGDDQVCVSDQNGGLGGFRCVRVAPDCAAHPTCECTNSCFAQCSDESGISCFCITC